MAEFCLKCWSRINRAHYTERDYVLSRDLDLCEGCGEFCRVVVRERTCKFLYDLRQMLKTRRF